jgi:hypothetical protein
MLKNQKNKPMKKIKQYLPFILWSISTIILTVLALIFLPILLLWEKIRKFNRKDATKDLEIDHQEYNTYDFSLATNLSGK